MYPLVPCNAFQLDIFQSLGLIIVLGKDDKNITRSCRVTNMQATSSGYYPSPFYAPKWFRNTWSLSPTFTQLPPYRCLGPNHPPGSSDPTKVTLEKALQNMLLRVHGEKKLLDNPECGEIDPDWCNISPLNSLKRYPIPCKYGRNQFCSSPQVSSS